MDRVAYNQTIAPIISRTRVALIMILLNVSVLNALVSILIGYRRKN